MFLQTAEGQLKSSGGLCVVLAANSPVGGGVVHLEDCHAAAAAGDGRSFWFARCCVQWEGLGLSVFLRESEAVTGGVWRSVTASAQLSMARGGGSEAAWHVMS